MVKAAPLRRAFLGVCFAAALAAGTAACNDAQPPLVRLIEARKIAMDLRLEVARAVDASNRAVMADTDETSIAFAAEAELEKKAVRRDRNALKPLLTGLGYAEETKTLEEFAKRYADYETLDASVLELAVENTNLKAQHLSFGPARDAANAFRASLEAVSRAASAKKSCQVGALVSSAVIAVREIQVLHAPHIAEADDTAMTQLEKEMGDLEASARTALGTLSTLAEPAAQPDLAAASASLDRFKTIHVQIVALSRRNTNVRSLMLSLGQKRTLSSACEASLTALSDALSKRGFSATR